MVLLTIAEVKAEATSRGVDLTNYTDIQITGLISDSQAYIEKGTGRAFGSTTEEKGFHKITTTSVLLKRPIIGITKIIINNVEKDLTTFDYFIDKTSGILELDGLKPVFHVPLEPYNLVVEYTRGNVEGDNEYTLAKGICLDLLFIGLENSDNNNKDVQSFKDGDFSITYTGNSMTGISNRIDGLRLLSGMMG
jgi:hypothetical protein